MSNNPGSFGINCGTRVIDGIYQTGNHFIIRQQYVWRENGIVKIKDRFFKGIKIN